MPAEPRPAPMGLIGLLTVALAKMGFTPAKLIVSLNLTLEDPPLLWQCRTCDVGVGRVAITVIKSLLLLLLFYFCLWELRAPLGDFLRIPLLWVGNILGTSCESSFWLLNHKSLVFSPIISLSGFAELHTCLFNSGLFKVQIMPIFGAQVSWVSWSVLMGQFHDSLCGPTIQFLLDLKSIFNCPKMGIQIFVLTLFFERIKL